MPKVTAYFNRKKPFFLEREPSFYGTEVEVDENAVRSIYALRELLKTTELNINKAASGKYDDQRLCDEFVAEVQKIFKTRKQDNTQATRKAKKDGEE